ncbi:hypothetical protein ACHAXS_009766 [Conticribra weissflogii]
MMRLVQSCTFRIGKFVNAIVAGGGNCTRSTCCAQVVVGFSSLAWRSTCCRSGIEPSHFPSHSFQIVPVTHSSGSKYFSGKSDDKINGRNEEDVEVEFVNVTSKKKTHVDINDLDLEKFTHEVKVRMPDVGDSEGVIEKWYKKEGDLIQREDVICDIRTDRKYIIISKTLTCI